MGDCVCDGRHGVEGWESEWMRWSGGMMNCGMWNLCNEGHLGEKVAFHVGVINVWRKGVQNLI